MTDAVKYHLKLLEVTGSTDDQGSVEYVRQLAALLACDGSGSHAKKWARTWLDEIKHQQELVARLNRAPAVIA